MNDTHFETSLRALRPSAPPAALEERIEAGLSHPEPSPAKTEREPVSIRFEQARESLLIRCFHSLGWAIAGAASAVAAIALYPAKPGPERPQPPAIRMSATASTSQADAEPAGTASTTIPTVVPTVVPTAASLPADSGETGKAGEIPGFQAMETTRELVSTEEDGQVLYQNGKNPMRQVRYLYREHHSWTNPRTGARVDIEVPREDVFLKPVSLQ